MKSARKKTPQAAIDCNKPVKKPSQVFRASFLLINLINTL
jgi:hypothetical protein